MIASTMYDMLIVITAMLVVAIITTVTTAIVNAIVDGIRIATLKEVKVTLFFLLTITAPVAIRYFDGPVWAIKCTGVALLALAQNYKLAVHPFVVPRDTTVVNHIRSFIVPFVVTAIATGSLYYHGFMPGYPPLGDADLVSSFVVVFSVFFTYLELFGGLIRSGYSTQLANVSLFTTLHFGEMNPFHPNPIVIIVSAMVYGLHPAYAVHLAAVGAAVVASKVVQKVRLMRVKKD